VITAWYSDRWADRTAKPAVGGFDHAIEERKRLSVQESLEAVFKDMGFVEMGKDFCWDGTVTTISTAEARAMGKYVQ